MVLANKILAISEKEFYENWNLQKSSKKISTTNKKDNYFEDIIANISKFALGEYYWQVFENIDPVPRIIDCGGAISKLTPYNNKESILKLKARDVFNLFLSDDLIPTLTFVSFLFDKILKTPLKDREHIKGIIYSRVKNSSETYIWTALQYPALLFDRSGKITHGLVLYSNVNHLVANYSIPFITLFDSQNQSSSLMHYSIDQPYSITSEGANEYPKLSKREVEILHLLSQGNLSKQIAHKLKISKNTVDNHRQRLLKKFNAASSSELVAKAFILK